MFYETVWDYLQIPKYMFLPMGTWLKNKAANQAYAKEVKQKQNDYLKNKHTEATGTKKSSKDA